MYRATDRIEKKLKRIRSISAESEMYTWGCFFNRISDAIEFVILNKFHNTLNFLC